MKANVKRDFLLLLAVVIVSGCNFRNTISLRRKPDKQRLSLEEVFKGVEVSVPTSQPAEKKTKVVSAALMTFMQAKQAYLNNDREKTVELLKKTIEQDGNYLPARELLMKIYAEEGKDTLASQQAEMILRIKPAEPFAHYVLGSFLLRNKRYRSAGEHLYRAYLVWRKSSQSGTERYLATLAKLAASLSAQGYLQAAIDVYVPLINQIEQMGDSLSEGTRIGRVLKAGLPGFCMIVGEFALKTGQVELAEKYFTKAKNFSAVKKQAVIGLIRCALQTKQTEKAKKLIDDFVRKFGINGQIIELCKKVYPDEKWVRHILDIAGDKSDVLIALIRAANHRQTIDDVTAAMVELFAKDKDAVGLTTILLRSPDKKLGEKLVDALSRIKPASEDRRFAREYLLAIAYQLGENFKRSQELYLQVIGKRKDYLPAYVAYGKFLLYHRQWDEVIALVDSAPPDISKRASLIYLKGYAQVQQGKLREGIENLKEAAKLAPTSDKILLGLAEGYFQTGKIRQATMVLGKIIKGDFISPESLIRFVDFTLGMEQVNLTEAIVNRYRQRYGVDAQYRLAWAKIGYAVNHNVEKFRKNLTELRTADLPTGMITKELAQLEFDRGNYKRAVDIASRVCETDEMIAPYIYKQLVRISAIGYWKLLEYDKAERCWKMLLKYWPGDDRFKAGLAQMYIDAQEYEKAIKLLRKLVASKSFRIRKLQIRNSLISAMVRAGRLNEAIKLIDSWMAKTKGSSDTAERLRLMQLKLNACILAGDFDEAQKLLEGWIAKEQGNLNQWKRWLVMVLLREHKSAEALRLISSWQKGASKENRDFLESLKVPVLLNQHKYKQAIDIAEKLFKSADDKKKFSRAGVLIKCYQRAGEYGKAMELASKLITKYKRNSLYAFSLDKQIVGSLELAGKFKLAEDYIKDRLAGADNSLRETWQQMLVSLYFISNNIDGAIASLENILSENPQAGWANNSLGYALAIAGKDLPRAEKLIRRALATDPGNGSYLDSLGWVLYKQGRFVQAYKYEMMAYRLMGEDEPVLLDHLGDICYKLGKIERAREYWQRAVKRCKELTILDLEPNMPARIIAKLKKVSTGNSEDKK